MPEEEGILESCKTRGRQRPVYDKSKLATSTISVRRNMAIQAAAVTQKRTFVHGCTDFRVEGEESQITKNSEIVFVLLRIFTTHLSREQSAQRKSFCLQYKLHFLRQIVLLQLAQDQLLILFVGYSSLHLVYAFIMQVTWMRYLQNWRRVGINQQHSAPKRKVAGGPLMAAPILGLKVGCGNQGVGAKKVSD